MPPEGTGIAHSPLPTTIPNSTAQTTLRIVIDRIVCLPYNLTPPLCGAEPYPPTRRNTYTLTRPVVHPASSTPEPRYRPMPKPVYLHLTRLTQHLHDLDKHCAAYFVRYPPAITRPRRHPPAYRLPPARIVRGMRHRPTTCHHRRLYPYHLTTLHTGAPKEIKLGYWNEAGYLSSPIRLLSILAIIDLVTPW